PRRDRPAHGGGRQPGLARRAGPGHAGAHLRGVLMGAPLGVAVVGCGNISAQYLTHLTGFPDVAVLVCADLDTARAAQRAAEFGVPESGPPELALAHPGVELVVNLTVPSVHAAVASAALAAGKHVWNE